MSQIWLIMARDDWLWPRMTYQGSWGHQGVQGGARGHQGATGGSRLPPVPKRVIKQQNNGPKPWFKVPKVCPDPKRMVFTHLWGIWGHLGALKQRYLVKMTICQNPGFLYSHLHRVLGAIFEWFRNFPHLSRYPGGVENCQKASSFSKIGLCKREKICVIFSENEIFFSKKW